MNPTEWKRFLSVALLQFIGQRLTDQALTLSERRDGSAFIKEPALLQPAQSVLHAVDGRRKPADHDIDKLRKSHEPWQRKNLIEALSGASMNNMSAPASA